MLENDRDITQDVVVDKLITDTIMNQSYWWGKKNWVMYTEYKHIHKIKDEIELIFRIYHFKNKKEHVLNVFLSKKDKYLSILTTDIPRITELVNTIEGTSSWYNDEPD